MSKQVLPTNLSNITGNIFQMNSATVSADFSICGYLKLSLIVILGEGILTVESLMI